MKNKEKLKSTLMKDAFLLFLITLISGLALSYVYEITKAPIEQQQAEKKIKANQAVFIEASAFEIDTEMMKLVASTDLTTMSEDYKGITIDEISKAMDKEGKVLGYNVTISTKQSYSDHLTLVFGYSKEGVVKGIAFTTLTETAGLGMKAAKPEFVDQFLNKSATQFVVTKTGADSQDQIDAISGATITSKAVTNAVNAGIGFITKYATDLGGGQS